MQYHNTIEEAARLALANACQLAEAWFPGGSYDGDEYKPANHVRGDKTPGSFHINVKTGGWYDFADNTARGKDFVSLYAYFLGERSQLEAAKKLLDLLGGESIPVAKTPSKKSETPQINPLTPAPYSIDPSMFSRKGEPSMVHEYKTMDGEIIGYTVRIESENDKVTLPLFCFEQGWQYKGFKGKDILRPIYGLEKINERPNASVLVVEGEKCADVGQAVIDSNRDGLQCEYVTLSWLGGTQNANRVDWQQLNGRTVFIWPDNDEPGRKAAKVIAEAIGGTILALPPHAPKGWDIADATADEALAVLNGDYQHAVTDGEYFNPYADNDYYKVLGFINRDDTEYYYFLNKRTNIINKITSASLNKDRLTLLAPSSFYGDLIGYSESGSINWSKVREHVYEAVTQQGPFSPSNQRGRGVWLDNGRVVAHMGESLLIDGVPAQLGGIDSRFVYSLSERMSVGDTPLTKDQALSLSAIFTKLNWAHSSQAMFLMGWLFLAPICGALYWRPIIWVTGEAGSGKSWVMNNIVSPILGDFCLDTQGGSTEAGIRQRIKNQALPILIDEAESEDERARKRLQNILELARQASSSSTAVKVKGTAGGEAMEFNIASMFLFSSIKSGMVQVSDISRVVELQLLKRNDHEKFQQLQTDVDNLITPDFSKAFIARSIKMASVVNESIKLFTKEIKKHHDNARVADIFGALLGGYFGLIADSTPNPKTVKEVVAMCPLDFMNSTAETTDHEEALAHLLEHRVRVDSGNGFKELNISELIQKAMMDIGGTEANNDLGRLGLWVKKGSELQISNNHAFLKKVFKDTPWAVRWNETFRNFEGAEKHNRPLYFGKGQPNQRGYTIPLHHCNLGGEFENNVFSDIEKEPF